MSLKVYNSLTRQEESFYPLVSGKVQIYCCGVTVYDYCHLGHARSYIVWDTIRRYLIWRGYEVRYVQNFTDIDDKILNRAREQNLSMEAVSERFIQEYFIDMDRLNIMRADEYPRATHTLDGIKRLIHELEEKGYAYAAGGDVYYPVRKFEHYGQLSGRKLSEMEAGASGRLNEEIDESKKQDPFDFALWKSAKIDEPFWESKWGKGRPGWHIECSAMVRQCLGETIDIHCGGADLIFPHHENEIAQSEAVTGKPLARYWMHNGFVTVNGEKMSKSLGNFTTIRQLLETPIDPMAVRLFVLMAHYRKPIDFTSDSIASATNGWTTLKEGLLLGLEWGEKWGWDLKINPILSQLDSQIIDRFNQGMDDDFNTSSAVAVLFDLAKELRGERNRLIHGESLENLPEFLYQKWLTLSKLAQVLGLEIFPDQEIQSEMEGLSDAEIEELIEQRKAAKKMKNFAESDRIREELKAQGVTLIDQKEGRTLWHRS